MAAHDEGIVLLDTNTLWPLVKCDRINTAPLTMMQRVAARNQLRIRLSDIVRAEYLNLFAEEVGKRIREFERATDALWAVDEWWLDREKPQVPTSVEHLVGRRELALDALFGEPISCPG